MGYFGLDRFTLVVVLLLVDGLFLGGAAFFLVGDLERAFAGDLLRAAVAAAVAFLLSFLPFFTGDLERPLAAGLFLPPPSSPSLFKKRLTSAMLRNLVPSGE